jgi:hypothetical protein
MEFNPLKNEIPFPPIDKISLFGEITAFAETPEMAYFLPTILEVIPNFEKQTFVLVPYDAFNSVATKISTEVSVYNEINVAFKDENQMVKNGEKQFNELDLKSEGSNYMVFQNYTSKYFRRKTKHVYYSEYKEP